MATPRPFAFVRHNHRKCCGDIMASADQLAERSGLRLTPVRRRALEILSEEHRAFGAYEVLDKLVETGFARQPPVAYRALEFLVENGLAHKIQRLNAFAACTNPGERHAPVFLICAECNAVAEMQGDAMNEELGKVASGMGFHVERTNVEAIGLCPRCGEREGTA